MAVSGPRRRLLDAVLLCRERNTGDTRGADSWMRGPPAAAMGTSE
jgi:hypothetical protein